MKRIHAIPVVGLGVLVAIVAVLFYHCHENKKPVPQYVDQRNNGNTEDLPDESVSDVRELAEENVSDVKDLTVEAISERFKQKGPAANRVEEGRALYERIAVGMSNTQIIELLGDPDKEEEDIWFYTLWYSSYIKLRVKDGALTEKEIQPKL